MINVQDIQRIQKDLEESRMETQTKLALAARAAGATVIPSPNIPIGKPILMVSPETWEALIKAGYVKKSPEAG